MKKYWQLSIILTITLCVVPTQVNAGGGGGSPDGSWAVASGFEIYESSSLTWDAGTLVCSATLTDTDGDTATCSSNSIQDSTQYRVQVVLSNAGTANVDSKAIQVFHINTHSWAGSGATLGNCAYEDFGADDGTISCVSSFDDGDLDTSLDDVLMNISQSGPNSLVIAQSGGTEGFMYLITTGSVSSDTTSYYLESETSEQSSKIDITATLSAPTVTTNDASSITENSATLNGEITAGSANERGFAWGITADLSGGDTATDTSFGSFGTGAFTDPITSLTPGAQYYFRAYAANATGTSTGSILSFRSLLGQPRALLLGTFLLLSGTLIIF